MVLRLGSRSETPGKFRNVVLEKDGEDQLDVDLSSDRLLMMMMMIFI
jgi:hypothetical protein